MAILASQALGGLFKSKGAGATHDRTEQDMSYSTILILGVLTWLDVRLTVVTMAVLPVMLYATRYFRPRMRSAFRDIRLRLARLNNCDY